MTDGSDNTIGGTAAGSRNVVSWNQIDGLNIRDEQDDLIEGNYIGVTSSGEAPAGNAGDGVYLYDTSASTIGGTGAGAGNVISDSGYDGVLIAGNLATGDLVAGNLIGTDAGGTETGFGNSSDGVLISSGAGANTIGGTSAAATNVLSGNRVDGVAIAGGSANVVEGDEIGTELGGEAALPNGLFGVVIESGTSANTVGGLTSTPGTGAGDLISGNTSYGVLIEGTANVVEGDLIGTDATGQMPLPNAGGVWITSTTTGDTIGGTAAGARNVIAGNTAEGIYLNGAGAAGNLIAGDWVGVNVGGAALANGTDGVELEGAGANTLSGDVVSGNTGDGVLIAASPDQTIEGNLIGTDPTGAQAIPNSGDGIDLASSASVTITGNLISGNTGNGIAIEGSTGSAGARTSSWVTRSARTSPAP